MFTDRWFHFPGAQTSARCRKQKYFLLYDEKERKEKKRKKKKREE